MFLGDLSICIREDICLTQAAVCKAFAQRVSFTLTTAVQVSYLYLNVSYSQLLLVALLFLPMGRHENLVAVFLTELIKVNLGCAENFTHCDAKFTFTAAHRFIVYVLPWRKSTPPHNDLSGVQKGGSDTLHPIKINK